MSKISVIIPCYNASNYIERCVNALEKQSFQDFEVIMIDDCSSDNTIEVINKICKRSSIKITLLINDENLGPAVSRNKGICYAKSEYVTFCDCDDWYDSDFLEILYENLIVNNSELAFCGYKVVNEVGKKIVRPLNSVNTVCNIREALSLDCDSLCMMMVKTDVMKSTLLPDIRNGEDMAVTPLLIIKAKGCVTISNSLYNYFRRSDSVSQSPSMHVVDSLIESFRYIVNNVPKGFDDELEYIGVRNLLYSGLITLFTFSNNIKKGKEIIDEFEESFCNWISNPFIKSMPRYKRVFLKCVQNRFFLGMKLIAIVRMLATRG